MRRLLGVLISLVLILELRGLAIANPAVDGGHALASEAVVTERVAAQSRKRFCDEFGGVWDITIQKRSGAISGKYTDWLGCIGDVTGQKTGRKLDMTATGLSSCQCYHWQHTVVTKIKYTQGHPYWQGTTGTGGGDSDCDQGCCVYTGILRCKDMP